MDSNEIVKSKMGRPKGSKNKPKDVEIPGDNARYNAHVLEIMTMPKINTNDYRDVHQRSIDYFMVCQRNDMKPNAAGYALALGVSRNTLRDWVTGRTKKPKEVQEELDIFYNVLTAQMEDMMQNGKINPVSGIFLAKNNYGYTDKQEVVVTPNTLDDSNADSLIDEARMLSDDVVEDDLK